MHETQSVPPRVLHGVVPEGIDAPPGNSVPVVLLQDFGGTKIEGCLLAEGPPVVLGRPPKYHPSFPIVHQHDQDEQHNNRTCSNIK